MLPEVLGKFAGLRGMMVVNPFFFVGKRPISWGWLAWSRLDLHEGIVFNRNVCKRGSKYEFKRSLPWQPSSRPEKFPKALFTDGQENLTCLPHFWTQKGGRATLPKTYTKWVGKGRLSGFRPFWNLKSLKISGANFLAVHVVLKRRVSPQRI